MVRPEQRPAEFRQNQGEKPEGDLAEPGGLAIGETRRQENPGRQQRCYRQRPCQPLPQIFEAQRNPHAQQHRDAAYRDLRRAKPGGLPRSGTEGMRSRCCQELSRGKIEEMAEVRPT